MLSGLITAWQTEEGEKVGQWQICSSWAPKPLQSVTAAKELKRIVSWQDSNDKPRQCVESKDITLPTKVRSHDCGLPSGQVQLWELHHKEGRMPKNRCLWTVVLEKTFGSPLDYKEIKPVNLKGDQPWIFTGRADAEAETPIFWLSDANSQLIGKDPDAG